MPLLFSAVCELLEETYDLCVSKKDHKHAVRSWFQRNRSRINGHDTNISALLSTLLPGARSDRVYCIQTSRLENIIRRGLCLGSSRLPDLARYRDSGSGVDLAECVERVLLITPNYVRSTQAVTVEEVDELLHGYAANFKWSSPSIRASHNSSTPRTQLDLGLTYARLSPVEGKWFTRLVLKNYEPLVFDSTQILRECDPALPAVLKVREDFSAALELIQSAKGTLLPNLGDKRSNLKQIRPKLTPQVGVKVGRQTWVKARSIKHCLDLGYNRMSVEYKADGEYCQIHIDLSKGRDCIKIFSKSGKDSTEDREALHSIIKDSLNIGKPSCKFRKTCILEGELLVYSDLEKSIMPFHRIRNFVTRRGIFLNSEADDRRNPHEHLMILYYDALHIDDTSMLSVRHSERLKKLSSLVECQPGYAELVQRETIDFNHRLAASNLRNVFAKTITRKQEGLVLKPDLPYFHFFDDDKAFKPQCIKLKKEYIGNFGDVGDFSVVGAGYDPVKVKQYKIVNLKWTHFYLGCLTNKEEVRQWAAKPKFTVVHMVEVNETLLTTVVRFGNPAPVPRSENSDLEITMPDGVESIPRLSVVFTNPLVFDMRCFSFDKHGNTNFWSLRFPAATKVHFDRDWKDCLSFDELQEIAANGTTVPEQPDSQENLEWIARLEAADPRGIAVDAVSQQTSTTARTSSPYRSTQDSALHVSQRSATDRSGSQISVSQPRRVISLPNPGQPPLVSKPPTSAHIAGTLLIPEPDNTATPHGRAKREMYFSQQCDSSSAPRKRRKSANESHPVSSESQRRKPLTEISGNPSQDALQTSNLHKKQPNEPVVIDLTESPEPCPSPQIETHADLDNVQHSHPEVEASLTASCGTMSTATTLKDLESSGQQLACKYCPQDCQLDKLDILIAPSVVDNPELPRLLQDHGIGNVISDIAKWLADGQNMSKTTSHRIPETDTIMLVDSLKDGSGTEALLKQIEDGRRPLGSRKRRWVRIYEWRVLEYISIFEDTSIEKKYYDGFSEPWARWYYGLV